MSDEYQLRKDIDRVINDVYNLQSNELDIYKKNEIDTKFDKYYDKGQVDEMIGHGGGGDLSNYYTKTEINTILSSYVTNETLDDYALKSELFSGSYTDLTNVPSSFPPSAHTHDDRYYTESEVDTALSEKQATLVSGTNIKTVNSQSILGSGDISTASQNVFYGSSSTSASTQTKVVTVDDWEFSTGNILFVKFTNANTYNGTAIISIDGVTKDIATVGTTKTSRYYWKSGELVGFVYDGTNMLMLEAGTATTTYYGVTKLSDSTTSTSTSLSATANAVKKAYDLADSKADANHTHTVSDVTDFPSIPSHTSDLVNDGAYGSDTYVEVGDLSNVATSGSYTDLSIVPSTFPPSTHTHDDRYYTESEVDTALNGKQPTLVSGTNIKTINNESLLGSGNIVIGGTGTIDDTVTRNSPNPVKSSGIWSALQTKQEDLSQSSNAYDGYGISIFFDDGGLFYGMGGRLYYDWADTEELHYYTSNSDDINFDDIIVEGDSRLSDARTPTSHSHQISDVTNLQTSLNGKANSTHSHSISDVTNLQSTLNDKLEDSDLLDLIYPIGAIYMEKDTRSHSVCPIQQTLGGTWTRIENRFLYASENGQGLGNTGGEETHTLTESEMPSHNHTRDLGVHYLKNAATASASSHVTNWSNHYDTAVSNNTKNTGGGQAHNNMPPFIIVNVWERTA